MGEPEDDPARDLRVIGLDAESQEIMREVSAKLNVSARVFDRILKVGRTIADLADASTVSRTHLAEAVQYRETKQY